MSTGILVLTNKALANAIKIESLLEDTTIYAPSKLKADSEFKVDFYDEKFSYIVDKAYKLHSKLIFIMATGIVVRSVAHMIKDKTLDPAIVVMDEDVKFCISLLGGHIAGANQLANQLADLIGCIPVITTATDVNNKGALDIIAHELGAYDNSQRDIYKAINYNLATGKKVYLLSDIDLNLLNLDIRGFEIITLQDALDLDKDEYVIHIRGAFHGDKAILKIVKENTSYYEIKPQNLVLGIGCRRNTSYEKIQEGLNALCDKYLLEESQIKTIASIELKKNESGIIELASKLSAPFITYDMATLDKAISSTDTIEASDFVKSIAGVSSVAEASAYKLSKGKIILPKQIINGVTFSLGIITKYRKEEA